MYQQYDTKNWYAVGATKEGQHLLENLGFTDIVSLNNGERKGYYLSDITKPTRIIRQLLEQMEQTETWNETEHELTVDLTAYGTDDSTNARKQTNKKISRRGSIRASEQLKPNPLQPGSTMSYSKEK